MKRYSIPLLATLVFFALNWFVYERWWIGTLALIFYFVTTGELFSRLAARISEMARWNSRMFGLLLSFYLTAIAIGIPIVLWKYDHFLTLLMLILVGCGGLLCLRLPESSFRVSSEQPSARSRRTPLILWASACIIFVLLLFKGRTGSFILSPWDTLLPLSGAIFFVIVFLTWLFVFSNRKVAAVLTIIILSSFVTHLTLPITYATRYGGDQWRHLASERMLQEGKIYSPSVWGEEKHSLEALIIGNKTSYAPLWGMSLLLSESLSIDLDTLDRILVVILWSLFIPLVLFRLGALFFDSEHKGLVMAALPFLFATFQTEGSLTLPSSFGFPFFLFTVLIWLSYLKTKKRSLLVTAIALTLLSYWSYLLFFVLLLIIATLALLWQLPKQTRAIPIASVLAAFAIPFLEIAHGLSAFTVKTGEYFINAITDFFMLLGWITGVVWTPLGNGNILYHATSGSLADIPLLQWTTLPTILTLIVWFSIGVASYRIITHSTENTAIRFLLVIGAAFFASYLISWSFTDGLHILARRLPQSLAFFMMVPLATLIVHARVRPIFIASLAALIATSTFASGPTDQIVTEDEVRAAEIVWNELKAETPPYCVIANTWPLLGLEAVSRRNIIAGGFPLHQNYAQTERVKVFTRLSQNPTRDAIEHAKKITGASQCHYMIEERWLDEEALAQTQKFFGEPERIGDVLLWKNL